MPGAGGGRPPRVLRGFEPPEHRWSAGHRGVDLAASPGTRVRAAAAGRVVFAGTVAGRGVLSVELTASGSPPLRITYEPVRPEVAAGAEVAAGDVVATLTDSGAHGTGGCLHWGLLWGDEYLDPLSLLPARMKRHGPSRLLPVRGVPFGSPALPLRTAGAGGAQERQRHTAEPPTAARAATAPAARSRRHPLRPATAEAATITPAASPAPQAGAGAGAVDAYLRP